MIARRLLALIIKSQAGFTGLEMVIAVALAGIIGGAAIVATMQLIEGSDKSISYVTAVDQVQSAGYWVGRDAQMAQDVVATDPDGFPLQLTWDDWDGTNTFAVNYTLEDMSGAIKRLQRHYTKVEIASGNTLIDATTIVAEYIDSDNTSCVWDDDADKLTFTVTAKVGAGTSQETSKARTYEIFPRPHS